ncbi:MAG: hypothetical protein V4718_12815 [Pseudomonadota bacterium]
MKKMIGLVLALVMSGGAFAQASFGKAPEKTASKKDDKSTISNSSIRQETTASGGSAKPAPGSDRKSSKSSIQQKQ